MMENGLPEATRATIEHDSGAYTPVYYTPIRGDGIIYYPHICRIGLYETSQCRCKGVISYSWNWNMTYYA